MTDREQLRFTVGFWVGMIAGIFLIWGIVAFADERQDDQLPKDYQKAEDIIAKKKKSGHHEAYYLMWPSFWEKQKNSAGRSAVATTSVPDTPGSEAKNIGHDPEIPAIALAMLVIPPPPPRDFAHEPGVQFAEGVSQEFIAWATMPKKEAKK